MIQNPDWEVIVFDEAHHLSRKRYGNKIQTTQNYRLAERVKGKTRDLLFLTATPHQGDPYQFWSLIQLLDDQLFAGPKDLSRNNLYNLCGLRVHGIVPLAFEFVTDDVDLS